MEALKMNKNIAGSKVKQRRQQAFPFIVRY